MKEIKVRGAKENNLKNIDIDIPRDKLVVFTGVSGSGKTTLAFNTIYAEGHRRYMESLSSYARMFLGQMSKPDVDSIDGLSPVISIDQKTTNHNPRSTVGTTTEIYDYLRLLFARIGEPYCSTCGEKIERQTTDEITDRILEFGDNSKIIIKAPVIRGEKGTHQKELFAFKKQGFVRAEINGSVYNLDEEITLDKNLKHTISVVVDRLVLGEGIRKRLFEAIEKATNLTGGLVEIDRNGEENILYNTSLTCKSCGNSIPEITHRSFSFNNPYGACPKCTGLGYKSEIDVSKLVKFPERGIGEGAITASGWSGDIANMYYKAISKKLGFKLTTPWNELSKKVQDVILYGLKDDKIYIEYDIGSWSRRGEAGYEGIIPNILRRYRETSSESAKEEIRKLMAEVVCDECNGKRLSKNALSVKINGQDIIDLCNLNIDKLKDFLANLKLNKENKIIAGPILKEINARLNFLVNVGLNYITLSRNSATLSGGESQRIRLATQIGSGLTGVLYILDEPSIGLHQRDNDKLLKTLTNLRDLGNSLIVVEHDEDTINVADFIVDVGPKAGVHGGKIVALGTADDIKKNEKSLTGDYLSGRRKIEVPKVRRIPNKGFCTFTSCKQNNLQDISVSIPAGVFTAITGVSGSGKSSLINGIVKPALSNRLNRSMQKEGKFKEVKNYEIFDKVINIDQSPIGRTPRSNPATYTGVWTHIRELFASTSDAKERGYKASRFSFNISGGRCEACGGDGLKTIEMYFLPDVYVECEECNGKRYNKETLDVKYKDKNIYEVLEMTVEEALKFFENIPKIKQVLASLNDVGLGYVKLGQSATTLSGGEAQRVKLATELCKRSTGKTIYILDEPTTGLHFYDVHKLINILERLVKDGNTVVVIEHNLDVIKSADYVIDLGPEGGDGGGNIVAIGTPEEVCENKQSYTGMFLKKLLKHS